MDELAGNIQAEFENIDLAIENLSQAIERKTKSVVEMAAIGTFIHNIYNGIENILKQCLKKENCRINNSAMWHRDLLKKAIEFNVVTEDLGDILFEYLGFRHFFVHSYGFKIQEKQIKKLAENAGTVVCRFKKETEKYIKG